MKRKPFDTPAKITRSFGFKDPYYTKYGFLGHEGIDLVPSDGDPHATVRCVMSGIVIKDTDNYTQDPSWVAYGTKVVVWNKEKHKAHWYCHLNDNSVSIGQTVNEGDEIGHMGNTSIPGVVFGAHLHFGEVDTDDNGNRINTNNGYKGFVDPLPYLESTELAPVVAPDLPKGDDVAVITDSTKIPQIDNKEVQTIKSELLAKDARIEELTTALTKAQEPLGDWSEQAVTAAKERDEWKKKFEDLTNSQDTTITVLKEQCADELSTKNLEIVDLTEKLGAKKSIHRFHIGELLAEVIRRVKEVMTHA